MFEFTQQPPKGALTIRVTSKRYAAHFNQRRYWANIHDDRGLYAGRGTYGTRAEAMAEAERMIDETLAKHGLPTCTDCERQMIALRIASPLRAPTARGQADAGHLPLFVSANEPALF